MIKKNTYIFAALILIVIVSILIAFISIQISLIFFGGCALAFIVFHNPFIGFLIFIWILYIRPQDFIPGLGRIHITLITAILILLVYFSRSIIRRDKISILLSRQHILMLMLLLIIPASHLSNLHINEAWQGFNEFLTIFLLFYIIVSFVDNYRKLLWTIVVLVLSTLALSINGIIQFHRGFDLLGNPLVASRIRWIGAFENPNDLALLINSFFPFVLVNTFEKIAKWKKVALILIMACFIMALFYTNSRGGFIALLAILVLFSLKRLGLAKGIALGILFIIVGLIFNPSRMADLSPYGESASGRIFAWVDGLVMLKSNPLFGVGFGNFTLYQPRAAHSAFVECYAELGIIGYFTWLSLIYVTFKDMRKVAKATEFSEQYKYTLILQLSMAGFLASALFLSQAYSIVLYTIIALSTRVILKPDLHINKPKFLSGREVLIVAVMIVSSIIAFKVIAMLYI
jgi:putative inorganic carbon (HCO3(-)) transporter